jgi:hypothetical protein
MKILDYFSNNCIQKRIYLIFLVYWGERQNYLKHSYENTQSSTGG